MLPPSHLSGQAAVACTFFDDIDVGLLIASPDGRIFLINRSLQESLGIRDGGIGDGDAAAMLEAHLAPRVRDGGCIGQVIRTFREGAGSAEAVCHIETPDGEVRVMTFASRIIAAEPFQGCRLLWVNDITGREPFCVQAEERRCRLQAIFDNAPDAVLIVDDAGRCIDANPAASLLLGCARDGLLTRTIFDFLPAGERDAARHRWEMSCAAGKISGEQQIVRSDGSCLRVAWRVALNVLPGQHLGFIRDITARKQTELRLLHLAEIVEASDDAIVGLARDGTVTSWNRAAERIYGYTAGEAIGRPASLLAPPERRDETRSLIDRLAAGEPVEQTETVRLRKDGTTVAVSFAVSPIRDAAGRVTGASATVRDITRQKETERALREREAWFRGIYENAGIGMGIVDRGGHMVDSNPALRNMLGYRADELSGMHFTDFTHPDDQADELALFDELIAEMRERYQMEKRYVARTGYVFWGRVTATLVRDADGHPQHVIRMVEDIHERRQAEAALARRTADLVRLIRQLKEAHAEANLYLDIMTHDIRNANNVSSAYADLLVDVLAGDQWLYARKLRDAIRRSTEILANVDTIRKIHTEAAPLFPVDLDAVIRAEVEGFPGVSVRYDGPAPEVLADGLLPVIFVNLIGNAVKFGGPDVEIAVRVEEAAGTVRVSVEDTGPGVPDDLKEAVFHRFERGRAKGKGEGLGLFICRILAERYGGKIWVDDRACGRPGKGAAFRFTLRKAEDPGDGVLARDEGGVG
ncbi:PAS domain S-box protein [Methanoculleus sp. FWC-SCC1]|uniref:histidine kinase n=1 Tax=Methanoculleus frigidifontis TaxID=2584085 RepID=A0ABT8MD25_9EURY|nr:PAS domain S-box protein [Methanoculleus sp. FWC-SCC1]MDN7025849.1 PAS domain S-box protein [Methanoculleus sp. FWC-SCC1]